MAVRTPAPINELFNYESIAVQIIFWMFIRGISHGFNETQDYLVMARNFKDIDLRTKLLVMCKVTPAIWLN